MQESDIEAYTLMRSRIINNVIIPYLESQANKLSNGDKKWKAIGSICRASSQVTTCICTVFAFASGFFNLRILAFLSGLMGSFSLVFSQFSAYAKKESHVRSNLLNNLLTYLDIKNIPDCTSDIADTNTVQTNV